MSGLILPRRSLWAPSGGRTVNQILDYQTTTGYTTFPQQSATMSDAGILLCCFWFRRDGLNRYFNTCSIDSTPVTNKQFFGFSYSNHHGIAFAWEDTTSGSHTIDWALSSSSQGGGVWVFELLGFDSATANDSNYYQDSFDWFSPYDFTAVGAGFPLNIPDGGLGIIMTTLENNATDVDSMDADWTEHDNQDYASNRTIIWKYEDASGASSSNNVPISLNGQSTEDVIAGISFS